MQRVVNDERRMTVLQHLEELRPVLMISGGTWVLATLVAFAFNGRLLDVLERPIKGVLGHGHHLADVPFTPTALFVPLIVLFEASILVLARVFHR
jgi:Sec-independent protein secretion pathway component TatC